MGVYGGIHLNSMKKLIYLFLTLLLSCQEKENDFTFSVDDNEQLTIEVQSFIDSLKSDNANATEMFRQEEVLWYNAKRNGKLKGKPSISKNSSTNFSNSLIAKL